MPTIVIKEHKMKTIRLKKNGKAFEPRSVKKPKSVRSAV